MITATFHYLVKVGPNKTKDGNRLEEPFTIAEFKKILTRISDPNPLDEKNPEVVMRIKLGTDLPFSGYEEVEKGVHFGNFDGAYYGQQYRNNMVGIISADSLNLRPFNYLITRLRDGKILIGVTYNGQYGDYDGLRFCLMNSLRTENNKIFSRSITNLREEIGGGVPTELRLSYRNASNRPERRGIFGTTGVIAIKNTDYGDGFQEEVTRIVSNIHGDSRARKAAIALLVKEGNMIELDDDDIVGCSAIIRQNGRTSTVYFLGGNNLATRFLLHAEVDSSGIPNRIQVRDEMIKVMREKVIPLLV
jgi:hypothetical protein